MTEKQTTIIEINGVKLEVDLRHAKRIDQLQIGSRVKCLVKGYSNDFATYPGVIVGFEPFTTRPSIVVAYLENGYGSSGLKFKTFNSDTKDFEVVADIDNNALEVDREDILSKFDRDYDTKMREASDIKARREFFLAHFGRYFADAAVTA